VEERDNDGKDSTRKKHISKTKLEMNTKFREEKREVPRGLALFLIYKYNSI